MTSVDLWPIGNCQVSALIDRSGRFTWACVPRVDGDPSRAAGARVGDAALAEPAFYVVTGPGVIARAERVLADRAVAFQPVWLKDQDPNMRRRALEQQATDYRIIEAEVPESVLNAVIGDLESLDGVRLAPVGRDGRRSSPPEPVIVKSQAAGRPVPAATRGGRVGAKASGGAGEGLPESRPAPAAETPGQRKPLAIRKLRLVLISR